LVNFLLGGAGVLSLLYLVLCVWHKGRDLLGVAHPLRIEPVEPMTNRELRLALEKLEMRFLQLEAKLEQQFLLLNSTREQQFNHLLEKINQVDQSVQRLVGRMQER
jgi:hypothetical protein